ncbi:MAG: hypothetical protein K2K56_10425 [Lachnospiraceae bacterium]|nr:hypothetical protein [Lachnospiraceae bacterium]MDE6626765.1 hypothetical protein [Lachnospiraceae bacterium]
MRESRKRNCIIFIFLLISIVSVAGAGLEGAHQLRLGGGTGDVIRCFVEQSLLSGDNVTNVKPVETDGRLFCIWRTRTKGNSFSYRGVFYFLCVSVIVAESLMYASREHFILYGNRFLSKADYRIVYIQDKDGRKKIS